MVVTEPQEEGPQASTATNSRDGGGGTTTTTSSRIQQQPDHKGRNDDDDDGNTKEVNQEHEQDDDDEVNDDEDEVVLKSGRLTNVFRRLKCCGGLVYASRRFPNTFDLLFGVVLPLFSLILFSLLFGYILAKLESPDEIAANNDGIAFTHSLGVSTKVQTIMTKEAPKMCLRLYLDTNIRRNIVGGKLDTEQEDEFLIAYIDRIYDDILFKVTELKSTSINVTSTINEYDGFLVENNEDYIDYNSNTITVAPESEATLKPGKNVTELWNFTNTGMNSNEVEELFSLGGNLGGATNDNIDTTLLVQFMTKCGNVIDQVMAPTSITAILGDASENRLAELGSGISFNWIKCVSTAVTTASDQIETSTTSDGSNPTASTNRNFWTKVGETFIVENPSLTEIAVLNQWKSNQFELLTSKLEYYKLNYPNMTRSQRRSRAIRESLNEANGFENCIPDSMAAAWFWFTVMTTIGYGNTAPQTDGGRALVYIFGFISIMYFAAVLTKAGDIVTKMLDECVGKNPRLNFLAKDYVGVLMWGGLYYLWLLVVAGCTVSWKSTRADIDMEFKDAYWFSFISTTTVGLGDYYLEHTSIGFGAVVLFASLFLVGFVLLANFIMNLANLIKRTVFGSKNTDEYLHDGSQGTLTAEDMIEDYDDDDDNAKKKNNETLHKQKSTTTKIDSSFMVANTDKHNNNNTSSSVRQEDLELTMTDSA